MKTLLTNRRAEIAHSVGMPLIEMEKHLDAAIGKQAEVLTAAIEGRRKARLPLEAGQEGLELMADAVAQLIAARKAVHRAHRIFRQVQTDMGVGPIAYGDYGDSPDEAFTSAADARPALTAVA